MKIWVVQKFHYISRKVVCKFQAWEYSQSWEIASRSYKKANFLDSIYLSTLIWGWISNHRKKGVGYFTYREGKIIITFYLSLSNKHKLQFPISLDYPFLQELEGRVKSAEQMIYSTLETIQDTQYTLHSTRYTVHTLHIIHGTKYTMHRTQFILTI